MDPRDFADLFQQATYEPPDADAWAALMQVADRYGAPIGNGLDMPQAPQQAPAAGSLWGDRLAMTLAATPPPPRVRGFLKNAAVGAARGFATTRMADMQRREKENAAGEVRYAEGVKQTTDWRRRWLDAQSRAAAEHRKERAAMLKTQEDPEADARGRTRGMLRAYQDLGLQPPGQGGGGTGYMGMDSARVDEIAQDLADRYARGEIPADYRLGNRWDALMMAKLPKGFDLTRASMDTKAARSYYASLNGSIQVRLRQAIDNAYGTADTASRLSQRLSSVIPRSNLTWVNKGLLTLAKEGLGSPEATDIAQQLTSFVKALQFELANVYMGGGVPQNEAQRQAREIISPEMSPRRLEAAINAARYELSIRRGAIATAGAISPTNQFMQDDPMQAPPNPGGLFLGGRWLGFGQQPAPQPFPQPYAQPAAPTPQPAVAQPAPGGWFDRNKRR